MPEIRQRSDGTIPGAACTGLLPKKDIAGAPHRAVVVYRIVLPNPAADAPVRDELHQTTFINYLRTCFRWGGFPGFEYAEERPTELAHLVRGLKAI